MKREVLSLLFLINIFVVCGQIPELDVANPNTIELQNASGLERARMYYLTGNILNAEALLYAELEKGNFETTDFLLFANTLNADNKSALAKEFYLEYLSRKESDNQYLKEQLNQFFSTQSDDYQYTKIDVNSNLQNPTLYNGKVYSANNSKVMAYHLDCNGDFTTKYPLLAGLTEHEFGSISFYSNGTMAIASLINKESNSVHLFQFTQKKGVWKKPVQLFKNIRANCAFPYFDESSSTLYFSSDKQGGFGGYDIYVSHYNGKSYEDPINLGKQINTIGHDINPVKSEEWLYFSSNGHMSKGGYDIYKFKSLDDFNSIIRNCFDFNTSENDIALLPLSKNKYFVSRKAAFTSEFSMYTKPRYTRLITGKVSDAEGLPLKNAVLVIDESKLSGTYLRTNKDGIYAFKTRESDNLVSAIVMLDGYVSQHVVISEESDIVLLKQKPIEIIKEVIVYKTIAIDSTDSTQVTPIEDTQLEVNEPIIQGNSQIANLQTPNSQSYYIILGSSYDYSEAYDFWSKWLPDFYNLEIFEYNNNLYRIGFYAGDTEEQATESFKNAQNMSPDAWILRPTN